MRLSLIKKSELSEEQARHLAERLAAPEHVHDKGPREVWNVYPNNLYAVVEIVSGLPVGIAEASGPPDAANAGWWIDSRCRGQGYGSELVDLLASHLKANGYRGVGQIRVDTHLGRYDAQSECLKRRFKCAFERFPNGPLAGYFQPVEPPALVGDLTLARALRAVTRDLVLPCLDNTEFSRGRLDLTFTRFVQVHTVFSRRDRGNVPYLLSDLATDLRAGVVDRATIDRRTEREIRALAAALPDLPSFPEPVIVEDSTAHQYLVLEGNKRFAAVALSQGAPAPRTVLAAVGRTSLSWPRLLAHYQMNPAP